MTRLVEFGMLRAGNACRFLRAILMRFSLARLIMREIRLSQEVKIISARCGGHSKFNSELNKYQDAICKAAKNYTNYNIEAFNLEQCII